MVNQLRRRPRSIPSQQRLEITGKIWEFNVRHFLYITAAGGEYSPSMILPTC
jgi:hypothetical protein